MNQTRYPLLFTILFTLVLCLGSQYKPLIAIEAPEKIPVLGESLNPNQVEAFANMALANIYREYPNKPSNVMNDNADILNPATMHPVFYGCFDWHSAVHGHWMLVRLLKLYPENEIAGKIRSTLTNQFTEEKLLAEADYFKKPYNKSFERMYGWAWYLRLVTELHEWKDKDAQIWRENLKPLEMILVERIMEYLPKLDYPIRLGIHPDTAWGLGQSLDYARAVKNEKLEKLIQDRSMDYYLDDIDYPFIYEPSGEDFFSGGLNEADLMRRVLKPKRFARWLKKFCPQMAQEKKFIELIKPIPVSDPTDGKLVHLAGLDLSRAWTLQGIASALPSSDKRKMILMESAKAHARVGYDYVFSGHYEGEHWLATFAIYLHTRSGIKE